MVFFAEDVHLLARYCLHVIGYFNLLNGLFLR